ncbi:MAG: hypothetical protein DMD69_01310 [Gemmatimonadetes bacterium]|nr:MAG: hypothetical protein DMD69_01310 [Gemmatimonadota bacterium]
MRNSECGMRNDRGVTLMELLAVLLILGLLVGVSGLALGALRSPRVAKSVRALEAARTKAIRTGNAALVRVDSVAVSFLPDGSSSGGTIVDGVVVVVDPLTGAVHAIR